MNPTTTLSFDMSLTLALVFVAPGSCQADPVEARFAFELLQAFKHGAHEIRLTMAREQQKFLPQLAAVERLIRRALELRYGTFEHAPVVQCDPDIGGERRGALLGNADAHTPGERSDPRIAQRALVERARVARIAAMRQRNAKRNAVLRHHDVGRGGGVVHPRHLLAAADVDGGDIARAIAVLGAQIQNRLHRGMRADMAGKALERNGSRRVALAEFTGELRGVEFAAAEYPQEPELAFQHAC